MDPATFLPLLLAAAWLLPLASFTAIAVGYSIPQALGKNFGVSGRFAGNLATAAIVGGCLLSLFALFFVWLPHHPLEAAGHAEHGEHAHQDDSPHHVAGFARIQLAATEEHHATDQAHHDGAGPPYYSGEFYTLVEIGSLAITIGYYIDSLTVAMFAMVTLIASCIHFYAMGYMHEELHDVTDHETTLSTGEHLHRPGRYHRFFQYLSLFCFSMLGIVIAGNIAMVFVFWELVGICSYFLIGFYFERKSASNAANKAFIVNRVGDFGMIIGLMALWGSLGTFAFGDQTDEQGHVTEPGIFSQVRPAENRYGLPPHSLVPPDGMVLARAGQLVTQARRDHADQPDGELNTASEIESITWTRYQEGHGYWLLVIAGLGIFCGCVGKSAQFPLHVWLPDAMEGPTPVSALVHSATMVAAGVYLVGRFYPVFAPEVLLVIAYIGCITLFLAATIAIVATDIKRVLAYSTVSQLGYMMLALGVGGWVAGMFHLITHAFFKSLLFMCSGSVIHAVHSNEMTEMGGLLKKMPYTAITMLFGCLAIIGAGVPFVIGFSGYYSKDAILEQAMSFSNVNAMHTVLFMAAAGGAAITAFYMFRMWFMTFLGTPRNKHRYDHAHESPRVMVYPLVLLAAFALGVGWSLPSWMPGVFSNLGVANLLEQGRPAGTLGTVYGGMLNHELVIPNEHLSHAPEIKTPATLIAFSTAAAGVLLAAVIYWLGKIDPNEIRQQFRGLHRFLVNKWWFDELYDATFVRFTLITSKFAAWVDRNVIDGLIHLSAWAVRWVARMEDLIFDRGVIDGSINLLARKTWDAGITLHQVQTGRLRQYVVFIVAAVIVLFAIIYTYAVAR